MYAERTKSKYGTIDPFTVRVLEVYIPAFSVIALLGVTGWIASDAIVIIIGQSSEDEDEVDVAFLFAFASANFVIDAVSSLLFYARRKNVLMTEHLHTFTLDRRCDDWEKRNPLSDHHQAPIASAAPNLNMISALTHVGSDTMRTVSVFVAAIISSAGGQSSTLCDAWAAVIVTSTIIMAVIPLCSEIYKAATNSSMQPSSSSSSSPSDIKQPVDEEQVAASGSVERDVVLTRNT